MPEPAMIRARGDGVDIRVAEWTGKGKTVLCVHGLTANCRCWDTMAAALSPGHRLLAVDLRGRGLSDKPPTGYSEEHHIRDVRCVMDDLRVDRAVLMGHSLGGYIALGFAAGHPDRVEGLILIDAGGELSRDHWDRVATAIKPAVDRLEMRFPSVDDFLNRMKQAPFFNPWSAAIETYLRYDMETVDQGVRSRIHPDHIREEVSSKRRTESAEHYGQVTCPVLILRATEGIVTPDDILLPAPVVARMVSEIPDARFFDVGGTNHYSILFQPNQERDDAISVFMEDLT